MKMIQVNKDMLPYKLHLFLKHGGASFQSFVAPMASQRGISSKGVGLIYTLTPWLCSLSNMAVCAWADAAKLHRFFLIVSTAVFAVFLTVFFYLPKIPSLLPSDQTPVIFQCEEDQSCYVPCLNHSSVSNVFVDQLASCNRSGICDVGLSPVVSCKEYCIPSVKTSEAYHTGETTYSPIPNFESCLQGKYIFEDRKFGKDTDFENTTWYCITNMSFDIRQSCNDLNTSAVYSTLKLLWTREFWLNASCILLMLIGLEISFTLANTMCLSALGKNRHKLGQTKLFGALGWGIGAPISGGLVSYFSKGKTESDYTLAVILTNILLFLSIVMTIKMDADVPGKQRSGAVDRVLLSFHCASFLVTSLVSGIFMGFTWTFQFIYVRIVAFDWDPNFSDLDTLLGLLVMINMIVEVPFMFFSGYIIKKIDYIHTITVTLIMSAARLLLYYSIKNPWYFTFLQILIGASAGLFLTTKQAYADELAPKGAQATLQSIVSSFFAVGKSLGSFLCGISMDELGGSKTFQLMGISVASYTLIYMVVHCIHQRYHTNYIPDDDRGKYFLQDEHPDLCTEEIDHTSLHDQE